MKIKVRLPSGEQKRITTEDDVLCSQLLAALGDQFEQDFSSCILKCLDRQLDPVLSLHDQNIESGDVLELEIPGNIELAFSDIARRRRSKLDWFNFFTELNQRLVPSVQHLTSDYLNQVLSGQKEALRLLDARDYKFQLWMYQEQDLSPGRLTRYCMKSGVLRKFVTKNCLDQHFLIQLIASLDYGYCVKIDKDLRLRKSVQTGSVQEAVEQPSVEESAEIERLEEETVTRDTDEDTLVVVRNRTGLRADNAIELD